MVGTYNGGGTVIKVKRSNRDLEQRKAHWKRKIAREQKKFDQSRGRSLKTIENKRCEQCRKIRPEWKMRGPIYMGCAR